MDKKSLAVSKKFTEDSLDGIGALKGAPCEILSIENSDDGTHTITYQWTSNSGKVLQDTMTVKDGADAYALAVESGYEGTLEEWLLSLKGSKGEKGNKGDKGDKGDKGNKGDMGYGIPAGGLTGQVVTKKSGTDYDFEWETLGDASQKSVTTYVSPDDNDIPTSAAVYRAMSAMLTGVFHPAGEKTVAQLTSALLIEEHIGYCYLITDSGVTDNNWFGGAGQTIETGNMAVVNRASDGSFKFQLQKGINIDTSTFQERTLSTPIVVDGANKTTVEDALSSINALAKSNKTALASKVSTSLTKGLLKNDGTVDTNTYLTEHQDISGKQNKVLDTPIMVEDVEQTTVEGALSAINNKTYNSFPQGGDTGQVLAKKSNDDYDVEWIPANRDNIQMTDMPEITEDINGKIYQYVGETTESFENGQFYKAVIVKSYFWSSTGTRGYTLQDPDTVKIGDIFYRDADCTTANGSVTTNPTKYSDGRVWIYANSYQVWWRSSETHIISMGWQKVNFGGDETHGSSVSVTPILDTGTKIAEIEIDGQTTDLYAPEGGGTGGTSDFDELTNRPTESEVINISDLNLTLPAKPTDYPILFDDGEGTERQVGYYRRSTDGKVKPIYEKYIKSESFEATLPPSNDKVRVLYSYTNSSLTDVSINFTNLIGYTTTGGNDGFLDYYINDEYLQSSNRFIPNTDTKIDDFTASLNPGDTLYIKTNWVNSHSNNSWKLSGDYVVTGIGWQILSAESYKNIESDIYSKILYIKTTDEWKEV